MTEETGEALDARDRYVAWALSQLGERDPNEYFRICAKDFANKRLEHTKSWCGIFALAGLRVCNFCDWEWSLRPSEPGFVYRLPRVSFPEKGDIAVFQKGADGKDIWHHAIVKRAPEKGYVETIDGNVLLYPKEGVAERKRYIDSNASFYSIAGLLRD